MYGVNGVGFALIMAVSQLTAIVGEELLAQRLNMIHAVGRAARVPPRLVMLEYAGAESSDEAPVMLVGKVGCLGIVSL